MSINVPEHVARIVTRKDLATYRHRVSRAYIHGFMSTAQYSEYRRYLARVDTRLASER